MSEEEPAWRREVELGLKYILGSQAEYAIGFVVKCIQAAEQRGREAGLRDALHAVDGEHLRDDTGTSEDTAYEQAINHAHRAVQRLLGANQ